MKIETILDPHDLSVENTQPSADGSFYLVTISDSENNLDTVRIPTGVMHELSGGKINRKRLERNLINIMDLAWLNMNDFLGLKEDEKKAYVLNIVKLREPYERYGWMNELISYLWNDYPRCPDYHPGLIEFGCRNRVESAKEQMMMGTIELL